MFGSFVQWFFLSFPHNNKLFVKVMSVILPFLSMTMNRWQDKDNSGFKLHSKIFQHFHKKESFIIIPLALYWDDKTRTMKHWNQRIISCCKLWRRLKVTTNWNWKQSCGMMLVTEFKYKPRFTILIMRNFIMHKLKWCKITMLGDGWTIFIDGHCGTRTVLPSPPYRPSLSNHVTI